MTETTSTSLRTVGTVNILMRRIYALDAEMGHEPLATEVVVEPGIYPLYSNGLSTFWMMTGKINTGRIHRMGDGLFSMIAADVPEGPKVTFPSKTYGPDEWAEFLASALCRDGDEQRLRIHDSRQPS